MSHKAGDAGEAGAWAPLLGSSDGSQAETGLQASPGLDLTAPTPLCLLLAGGLSLHRLLALHIRGKQPLRIEKLPLFFFRCQAPHLLLSSSASGAAVCPSSALPAAGSARLLVRKRPGPPSPLRVWWRLGR